jgi:uncharacterized membrane protein
LRAIGLAALVAVAALLSARTVAADGIGVYPTIMTFEDTMRGGEYFSTLGLINSAADERTFTLEASGDIGRWISFVDVADRSKVVDRVVAPPKSDGYVTIRLQVPESAENGSYAGEVRAATIPTAGAIEGSGQAVSIAAIIEVKAEVSGKQRIEGQILEVVASDIEVGYPLAVRTKVQNRGNVRVVPQVHVEVSTAGKVVGAVDTNDVPVPPNEFREIEAKWDTNTAGPGDYQVTVTVALPGGVQLGPQSQPVRVLPRGSLTREGVFERLELANEPIPGSVVKVIAVFRNTGQVESMAIFQGELYRDGMLTKSVTSLQKLVRRDEVQQLEALVEIPESGQYTIKGKVNFEGKESEVKELSFEVRAKGGESSSRAPAVIGAAGGGGALLLVGISAALYLRHRRPARTSAA